MSIKLSDYNAYKSAIEEANYQRDKDALRRIQKELIATYGLNDRDVQALLAKFRFTV